MTQGALFSLLTTASNETAKTNVRVNEIYLNARVDYDAVAEKSGSMKSSEFGRVYEEILGREEIKGCRISVFGHDDVETLKYQKKAGK